MAGLWADGWFYISSAGLLVSGVLFFFLLGQYRAASEASDHTESEPGVNAESAAATVHPIFARGEDANAQAAVAPVASISADKPQEKPQISSGTGGISPAVVYLQNLKGELAELHQEVRALTQRVDAQLGAVAAREEALIERLGELARGVTNLKAAAVVEPAADATIRMEPKVVVEAAVPEAQPPSSPSPSEEKPRRGPVWPV